MSPGSGVLIDCSEDFRYVLPAMKRLPALLVLFTCAFAAEPVQLPLAIGTLKLRDGSVYEEAKVVGQDAVGLKIMHAGGTARLPYAKLPKELADRFPRDPEAARKQLEKEAKETTAHERSVDKALSDPAKDGTSPKTAPRGSGSLEKLPDTQGDKETKIAALQAYIDRMEYGIDLARTEAAAAMRNAGEYRHDSTTQVTKVGPDGTSYTTTRTSRTKLKKAADEERRAQLLNDQMAAADHLITRARDQIDTLRKSR
jgi:hypothetical protein